MASGVGLVTTVWLGSRERDSHQVAVLNAFLLYHVSIGIDHITVFFDGDAEQQPTHDVLHSEVQSLVAQGRIDLFYLWQVENPSKVQGVGLLDESIRLRYRDCVNYVRLCDAVATDVATRQMLHAEMAMDLHVERNRIKANDAHKIRWLLHLDVDELFYCEGLSDTRNEPSSTVFWELIAALEAEAPRIDQLTVVNYEAVPMAMDGGNYFMSTTRFRRHTARIPLSSASQAGIQAWQSKSPHQQFFRFYDNGKSLVRVPEQSATVVPASVHHWRGATSHEWRSVANFYDPRRSDATVWHESTPRLRCCVLHFPVCGMDWLAEKYQRLGVFSNVWGGRMGSTEMKIPPCFHLDARDAAQRGADELERLYVNQVMVKNSEETADFWRRQLHAGVCEEISFARELLLSKGFTVGTQCSPKQRQVDQPARDQRKPVAQQADDATRGYTVEKAWMLAAISDQYL